MKRIALFAVAASLGGSLFGGCSAPLAILPPSDTYSRVETPAPELTDQEKKLLGDINKEFDRLGLPTATLGGYECNVAAIMANVGLAKIWTGSGRNFATNQDVAAASSHSETNVVEKHASTASRVNSLTDEESDAELKHLHNAQHQVSYGIAPIRSWVFSTTYAKTKLDEDEIKKLVRVIEPGAVRGELKLGIAILPSGDADKRVWTVVIRDYTYDLAKGPPRTVAAGASFDIAGSITDKKIEAFTMAIEAPNGTVTLTQLPVDAQGQFGTTVKLPPEPGLYTFELVRSHDPVGSSSPLTVPIFAGVDPTPWPPSADPKLTPITGTHPLVERLAKAVTDYRRSHGLKVVPIDADMSAFSKAESLAYGKLLDESAGPNSAQALQEFLEGGETRVHLAGLDKVRIIAVDASADDYLNNYFTRFPYQPLLAARLLSPSLESIGLGAALVPTTVSKDDDTTVYTWVLTARDPTPPELQNDKSDAAPQTPATTPAAPAAPAPSAQAPAPASTPVQPVQNGG